MVLGIKSNKGLLLIAIFVLISSCGSRRTVQLPYNGPVQITENARVILNPASVATPVDSTQLELAPSSRALTSSIVRASTGTWKGRVQQRLDSLCRLPLFETTQLGLYVFDLTDKTPVYAVNAAQRMRPASVQKLITAVSALHYLGGNYRFGTDLRISGSIAGGTLQGDVYVVGGMDPLLSASDLYDMAAALRRMGINRIAGNLYADLSMKDDLSYGWGWCWDDKVGPLSALMVDAEDRFAGEWISALTNAQIQCSSIGIGQRQLPRGTKSVLRITHTIDEVLQPLLKNSQNVYAECLFYQIAAFSGQKNAGRKQAVTLINNLIAQLGMQPDRYQIADGSGLSLYNYATPELIVRLLNYAYRRPEIFQHLYPALPIAGEDGTLSKRMQATFAYGNVHAKTGSLNGISSLSGYLTARNGHLLSFCIMNQGVNSAKLGRDFQDLVCVALCR